MVSTIYLKVFSLTVLCSLVRYSETFEFSKDFVRCHITDNDCLLKRANEILHRPTREYSDLELGTLEPYHIGDIKISGNSDRPVNINWELTDLSLHGYTNLTITKFTGFTKEPEDAKIDLEANNPMLIIKGKYNIAGKLLLFPITGSGDMEITLTGLQIKARSKPVVQMIDGKKHQKMDKFNLKVKVDHMKIDLTNLFNGDKVLGESMLKVLNENWKLLWDEVEPEMNKELTKSNFKTLDYMMSKIPYEDLFIPN